MITATSMKQRLWFAALAIWTRHAPRMAAPSHYDDSTPLSALRYHVAGWLATITLFLTMAATARKPRWRSLVKALRPQRCQECGHPQYRALSTERHPLCAAIFAQRWKAAAIYTLNRNEMMLRAIRFAVESGGLTNHAKEQAPRPGERIAIDYARAMTGKPHFHTTE